MSFYSNVYLQVRCFKAYMEEHGLRWLDFTIAVVLCIGLVIGSILNSLSLLYFATQKTRNANSKFFQRLYSIIACNDILLCLGVFPVIEAALSSDRQSALFSNKLFCSIWYIVWYMIYELSIILIATLSISRLLLIRNINYSLQPWVPCIITGVTLTGFLTLYSVTVLLHLVHPEYISGTLHCSFASMSTVESERLYSPLDRQIARIFNFSVFGISIICFGTVCLSVILSLIELRKPSPKLTGVKNRQRKAAITVILMTLLYINFNTISTVAATYVMLDWSVLNPVKVGEESVAGVLERIRTGLFGDSYILNHYTEVVCTIIGPCLNSVMNPLVYYFRVNGFRLFIVQISVVVRKTLFNIRTRRRVGTSKTTAGKVHP